jgi:septum site-determining protein MinC
LTCNRAARYAEWIVPAPSSAKTFIRVRGRSFTALVLSPEPPVEDWLAGLDEQMRKAPGFFSARPVVVDLSALAGHARSHPRLIEDLQARDLRIIGVEGADESWAGHAVWGRPPLASNGKPDRFVDVQEQQTRAAEPSPPSLLIERPVRSGQSVLFERGDVTVIGSVASGAEIMAGGSIHVYGALRGRAVAGMLGQPSARIFCRKLLAELLAIDGVYKTADDMAEALRGQAVQAWLDGDTLAIAPLDTGEADAPARRGWAVTAPKRSAGSRAASNSPSKTR